MKFILTADDYGVSPIIDEAIEEGVEKGFITSVAAFANIRDASGNFDVSKVKALQEKYPQVSVGLHFTVTCGFSVTGARSLCHKRRHDKRRCFKGPSKQMGKVDPEQIYNELKAQIALFDNAGIEIEHFSDHHGCISHTKIGRKKLYKAVNEYNRAKNKRISIRNPVFISSLIKDNDNVLHISNSYKAARHAIFTLNTMRRIGNFFRKRGDLNIYQFGLEKQQQLLREMNRMKIPSTNYFVDSFWGLESWRDLNTVKQIFNSKNYNVDPELIAPLHKDDETVELMLHIAKSKETFSGDFDEEIKKLKKIPGISTRYVTGGNFNLRDLKEDVKGSRVDEFRLLQRFFLGKDMQMRVPAPVSLTTFKPYIRPFTIRINRELGKQLMNQ